MSPVTSFTKPLKRARRPAPKVRTGCATCKIRRVKCGEERPSCIRCTSTGRKCGGYAQSPNDYQSGILVLEKISTPLHGVSTLQLSSHNAQHLEFYHHCVGPALSSRFDKNFWSKTAPQIAQTEPCIRYALIALSHLNRTETGSLKDARANLVAASKQKTPLFYYNKAVNSLVQRLSEPSSTPEIGLVSCIIFICIEFLRGNYDTAWAHFNSGLKIISTLRANQNSSSVKSLGHSMIEESLIPIFIRLTSTAMVFGVPTELFLHNSIFPLEVPNRPFTSLSEANVSIQNIRNVVMLFMRNIGPKLMSMGPVPDEDVQHQKDILNAHHAWLHAFQEFERRTTLSDADAITVHAIKVSYYCMYITIACGTCIDQTEFDRHLDRFKTLINHARIVLDSKEKTLSKSSAANFTFDVGIVPYLYITVCRCRCPVARRAALGLLERNPPREGLWDVQQHAIVAKRIIEIEESELDPITGWPTERARIWSAIIRGDIGDDGRFAAFFAVGLWGEGRGIPPLPPGMVLTGTPEGRMWKEWFVL